MTPLSQKPSLPLPANLAQQAVSGQQHKPAQSASNSSTSSDVPMVSPSELDTSVFKSPTPSELSENQNRKMSDSTSTEKPAQDDNTSGSSRNAQSQSVSKADDYADTNLLAPADNDQTITDEHPMEVSAAEISVDKITKDTEATNTVKLGNMSPAPAALTRQSSRTGNSSPRMCLSLKRVKVTSSSVRRSLNMNAAEDKNPLETSSQFVLGVGANEGELDSSVESQFHLPVVQVPSDSQFELSGDSQTLFQIQNPATSGEIVGQPPVSSSQKQPEKEGNHPTTTPFAFVNPAQSSRQAIKKAKESSRPDASSSATPGILSNQEGCTESDPYAYDSQNVDSEVDFIMQRKAKRASSGPNVTNVSSIAHSGHSGSQKNPGEHGDPEVEKMPVNIPSFSSEPPSLNTADIRRPVIQHHPPSSSSHVQSHVEGSQTVTSCPGDTDLSLSQSAAEAAKIIGYQSAAPSGSQPLADNAASRCRSPFLSPSLVLPSTSSGSTSLQSISPSAAVPSSLVDELKKRAGLGGGGDYQLKLVKVVRTIVEERHVFAEDVREGRVVQNSGRSWIVSQNIVD